MRKLFEVGHPSEKHIPGLKTLWENVFGDSRNIIDNFFSKTARLENTVCVFCEEEPVSVLYALESTICLKGIEKKAYYVYAVCTHPLYRGKGCMVQAFSFLEKLSIERGISYIYLVPAEKELFTMYEKLGFGLGFTRNKRLVNKADVPMFEGNIKQLSFVQYVKYRKTLSDIPQAILDEDGFNSFYRPVCSNMNCIYVENKGFALYDTEEAGIDVFEVFGDKEAVLSAVFSLSGAESLNVYEHAVADGEPYAMLKSLDGSLCFENGFFGVPYGG